MNKKCSKNKFIYKILWKFTIPYFKKLTYHLENSNIPSTNNKIENIFQKVKEAGVEFVYIRVGRGDGIGEDYVEDTKFVQNIKGFNEVGIPIGVYFYSNANGIKDAEKEAKYLLKQVKGYKVDLEFVFEDEVLFF